MTQVQIIQGELEAWEAETGQIVDLVTGRVFVVTQCVDAQLYIEIAGKDADVATTVLQECFTDGRLDLPVLTLLRAELGNLPGDWRIVAANVTPMLETGQVTP